MNAVLQIIIDESRRRRRMFDEAKEIENHIGSFLLALHSEMEACAKANVPGAQDIATRAEGVRKRYGGARAKLQHAMAKEEMQRMTESSTLQISGALDKELRAYSGSAASGVVADCVVRAYDDSTNTRFFQLDSTVGFERVRRYIEHLYDYRYIEGGSVFQAEGLAGGAATGGGSEPATAPREHLQLAFSLKGSTGADKIIRNDAELASAIEYYRQEMLVELNVVARAPGGQKLRKMKSAKGRTAADDIASMMRSNYGDRGLPEIDQVRRVV